MAPDPDNFRAHQEDLRRRADSLVRAMFVLAGGALTVSLGIFAGSNAPEIAPHLLTVLKIAWWSLFLSIAFLVLSLVVIIARDYANGERMRRKKPVNQIVWIEVVIWLLAVLGLIAFLIGMFGLADVASSAGGANLTRRCS